nr:uncharacterized protein LOC129155894 [Nothobranchius furzeri]
MYGCTRFQPELPPEETDDTVEEKRQRLQSTHSKYGINRQDRPEVTDLMNTTFSLQRKHINRIPAPFLTDLQTSWPYLFTQRGIFSHFELLTDVAILCALELSIEECGNAIVEYFRTKVKTANVQTILAQEETDDLTFLVVQLLMSHFKESPDGLILTTDVGLLHINIMSFVHFCMYMHTVLLMYTCPCFTGVCNGSVCRNQPKFASQPSSDFEWQ